MIRFTRAQVLPIGVDIGHDSVKMVQVEAVGESLTVTAAAKAPLPAEIKSQPQLRMPVAADLVRQMIRQHSFRGRRIVASLPREAFAEILTRIVAGQYEQVVKRRHRPRPAVGRQPLV